MDGALTCSIGHLLSIGVSGNSPNLHFGFLLLFHNFGYYWALQPFTEPIRQQLMRPEEIILEPLIA
jgi:hypothetical protein